MVGIDNIFFVVSGLLLFSAASLIIFNHTIYALLSLVSCFLFTSFLMFMLECEFLALLFVAIYSGAIAVLFLFAIMMLESKYMDLNKNILTIPVGLVFFIVLFIPVCLELSYFKTNSLSFKSFGWVLGNLVNWYNLVDSTSDIEVYGQVLYSYFVLHFLIVGLILMLVLVGVVSLTNSFQKNNIRFQQISLKQLSRKK